MKFGVNYIHAGEAIQLKIKETFFCCSYDTNFTLEMTVIGQRHSAQNEIALSEIVIKMHSETANESVIEIQGPEMDMKEEVKIWGIFGLVDARRASTFSF